MSTPNTNKKTVDGNLISHLLVRIEEFRNGQKLSKAEFCRRIGIIPQTYEGWLEHNRHPASPVYAKILESFPDANLTWLLTGEGEMFDENGRVLENTGDFLFFPRYNVEVSAGPGAEIVNEDVLDHLAFKTEWVKSDLKGSGRDFFLIHVRGESMEPTLRSGDLIMVDRRDNSFMFDAIYVFRSQGSILVKRIQILPSGEIAVISDNPAFETLRINSTTTYEDFEVIGRVVWHARQI